MRQHLYTTHHHPGPWRPHRCPVRCCSGTPGSSQGIGRCYLVGAGPGAPDLLTVRAVELLRRADVVVYDDLGSEAAVALYAPAAAERVYVGKRGGRASAVQPDIDALLVQHAQRGRTVVRLKGGCPSVFSRVHSELAALRAAGIPHELVPGVSSALAAPLMAGFPLTHPELGRAFVVASAHKPESLDWGALAGVDTRVLLMAGGTLPEVVRRLQGAGVPPSTPAAVVRDAGQPNQTVWRSTLGGIVQQTEGETLSPCVVVVGQVASLGEGATAAAAAAMAAGGAADGSQRT